MMIKSNFLLGVSLHCGKKPLWFWCALKQYSVWVYYHYDLFTPFCHFVTPVSSLSDMLYGFVCYAHALHVHLHFTITSWHFWIFYFNKHTQKSSFFVTERAGADIHFIVRTWTETCTFETRCIQFLFDALNNHHTFYPVLVETAKKERKQNLWNNIFFQIDFQALLGES